MSSASSSSPSPYNTRKRERSQVDDKKRDKEREQELKLLILKELEENATNQKWALARIKQGSDDIEIDRTDFSLTSKLREDVQGQGNKLGCHTCGTRLEIDDDQPWIGDHVPPTNLKDEIKWEIMGKKWDKRTHLFPQCDRCSNEQSALVSAVNGGKQLDKLTPRELSLLGYKAKIQPNVTCVHTTGTKVSRVEGDQIQKMGIEHGCRTCDSVVPASVYFGDHAFPQEFCTSYMEEVFRLLEIDYPKDFVLRPQCPRCSGAQGGSLRKIADMAQDYARHVGITVYK